MPPPPFIGPCTNLFTVSFLVFVSKKSIWFFVFITHLPPFLTTDFGYFLDIACIFPLFFKFLPVITHKINVCRRWLFDPIANLLAPLFLLITFIGFLRLLGWRDFLLFCSLSFAFGRKSTNFALKAKIKNLLALKTGSHPLHRLTSSTSAIFGV